MQEYRELNMQMSIPARDMTMFSVSREILEESQRLPLLTVSGETVGYAYDCLLYDKPGDKVGMDMKFIITGKLYGSITEVIPTVIEYRFKGMVRFKLLSHFVLLVAPI